MVAIRGTMSLDDLIVDALVSESGRHNHGVIQCLHIIGLCPAYVSKRAVCDSA